MDDQRLRARNHRPLLAAAGLGLVVLAGLAARAQANSAPCQFYPNGGTVSDTKTGLTWQAVASSTPYSLADAQTACATLSLNGTGPTSPHPWRMATIRELQTIVHEGQPDPAVDPVTFTDKLVGFFWSSTPAMLVAGQTWGVYFGPGNTGTADPGTLHYVRCVHGN